MLRRAGVRCFNTVGHKLGAPLALIALCLLVLLPIVDERGIYVSESNLKPFASSLLAPSDSVAPIPRRRSNGSLVVHGLRATGGVLTTVVVNHDYDLSVSIALALSAALRRRSFLHGDVAFVFFSDSTTVEEGDERPASQGPRLPSSREALQQVPSEVEVAIVLNVSHFFGTVCINVFGSNGLQPNMDVVNLVVMAAGVYGVEVDTLCQSRSWGVDGVVAAVQGASLLPLSLRSLLGGERAHRLVHYALSLLTAAAVDGDPADGGGSLRRRGIHPIVLETPTAQRHGGHLRAEASTAHSGMALASVVEALLRGINNLDERLHHSFPIYVHTTPHTFVDFEVAQHVIFIVLAALASDLYATVRARRGCNQPAVQGSKDVPALVVLVLGAAVWDRRTTRCLTGVVESSSSTGAVAAALGVVAQLDAATVTAAVQGLLTAAAVGFLALYVKGGDCVLVPVWNCVAVCLALAYHPLLALVGSVAVALIQVTTNVSASVSMVLAIALVHAARSTTPSDAIGAKAQASHSATTGDGVSSLFVAYVLVLNAIWVASRWLRSVCRMTTR